MEPLAPLKFLRDFYSQFLLAAAEKGVELIFSCVDEGSGWLSQCSIDADPIRLGQVE